MTKSIAEPAPGLKGRIAGGLWLIVIAAGAFALSATSGLIVHNDAVATANNILENESLLRFSIVANLVAGVCYVGVTVLLYELLKPVSRSLSLLAAFFGLSGALRSQAQPISVRLFRWFCWRAISTWASSQRVSCRRSA